MINGDIEQTPRRMPLFAILHVGIESEEVDVAKITESVELTIGECIIYRDRVPIARNGPVDVSSESQGLHATEGVTRAVIKLRIAFVLDQLFSSTEGRANGSCAIDFWGIRPRGHRKCREVNFKQRI